MKIGIYDPYLDTCGGGERYVLALASYLAREHEVDVFWDDKNLRRRLAERLDLDLNRVNFQRNIFSPQASLLSRMKATRLYDLIFYLSDGSIPISLAKRNILHFQVPFTRVKGKTFLNRLKLLRFQEVVANSYFTKENVDQTYGVKSLVIYPPVSIEKFKPLPKKNLVLSVGRFTTVMHAKKQHVLVNAFQEMCDQGLTGWKLVLAGGVFEGEEDYFQEIKQKAKGYPIEPLENVSFKRLKKLYGEARIYWHAAGFGEDLGQFPERAEHFGITTVEAMAAGCVPVVFQVGGQTEIIEDGKDGFLWRTTRGLKGKTTKLIEDQSRWEKLSQQAQERSQDFSQEKFYQGMEKII